MPRVPIGPAFEAVQRRADGATRVIWVVAASPKQARHALRPITGPNMNVHRSRDYRGPTKDGTIAYGPWRPPSEFEKLLLAD